MKSVKIKTYQLKIGNIVTKIWWLMVTVSRGTYIRCPRISFTLFEPNAHTLTLNSIQQYLIINR